MGKQEEIREGIKKVIADYFGLNNPLQEPFLNELPDLMVKYLHSQGVVIEVPNPHYVCPTPVIYKEGQRISCVATIPLEG